MKRREVPVPVPYDLTGTFRSMRFLATPWLRVEGEEVFLALRTDEGPVALRITPADGRVRLQALGDGAESTLARAGQILGLDDVEAPSFEPTTEPLRTLQRRRRGLRVGRLGGVFDLMVPAILAQKVPGKEASSNYRRMTAQWGDDAPGPWRLRLGPSARALRGIGYEQLHRLGVERARADRVLAAARRSRQIEAVMAMPRLGAYRRLLALRGIGPWTAAKVLFSAWGDADAMPLGDYHLPSMVAWNLAGEARADDRRMVELLEPYRGHRGRVLQLLSLEGKHPPRYGPRLELRHVERS